MALESFNVYHSYLKAIEPLTDAERGRLLTACLEYSMTGEAPELRGNERFIFPSWQSQIDRDRENYDSKCKKQSENAKMRWHAKDAMACGGINGIAKDAKDKDNDKDKDKRPCGASDGFTQFWKAYPKKKSKGDAEKAFKAINPNSQILGAIIAAVEEQKLSRDWTKDNGQFIPYPATWLRAKGWEDEASDEIGAKWRDL